MDIYERKLHAPSNQNFVVPMRKFILSVDLGTAVDHTALALITKTVYGTGEFTYINSEWFEKSATRFDLLRSKRLPLQMDYTEIIKYVSQRKQQVDDWAASFRPFHESDLVLDSTGVGRPIVDLFRRAGFRPVAVTITAGQEPTNHGSRRWSVPRSVLIMGLRSAFEAGELVLNYNQQEINILREELSQLSPQYTPSGNLTFQHRVGQHDDLVLSLAQGVWWARHQAKFGEPHLKILEG
jgi:hypothetical protein